MGRDNNERRSTGRPPAKPTPAKATFVSFTPQVAEMDTILGYVPDGSEYFTGLEELLENGAKVTLSCSEDGMGYKAVVFDARLPFDQRVFYSFYASTLARVLAQLCFVLDQRILAWDDGIVWTRRATAAL